MSKAATPCVIGNFKKVRDCKQATIFVRSRLHFVTFLMPFLFFPLKCGLTSLNRTLKKYMTHVCFIVLSKRQQNISRYTCTVEVNMYS